MKEYWHVQIEGGKSKILNDIYKVSQYEKELREQGLKYKTDYYVDSKLVYKSKRKIWQKNWVFGFYGGKGFISHPSPIS